MNKKEKHLVNVIQNAKQIINIVDNIKSITIKDGNDNIEIIIKREENKNVKNK